MSQQNPQAPETSGAAVDTDPRSVSDRRVLKRHSRAEVEAWRDDAMDKHRRWLDVMHNPYGKR